MDEAIDRLRADYDAVPYESHAYPQSAPGQLAAIAYLFGLDAPDVSTARVLEIGCAAAGNLIPFAAANPHARAVGIDLSQVQIDQGSQRASALGLGNLELLAGDIASVDQAALGQFDFIVCHGVYSWVPAQVRTAILSTIRTLMAPHGVAYLSYNVYPGWKAKEIVRDAMLLFSGDSGTPDEKVRNARGIADFLGEVAAEDSMLATALGNYQSVAGETGDYYLLHEELETFNAPCYFLEMLDRAREHGLAYLAEARPETMFVGNYGAKLTERLIEGCGDNQVILEQCLDFIVNRAFRQSLVVHADRAPQISYHLDRSRYGRLHFAAWVPPVNGPTRLDASRQQYGEAGGATLFTDNPGIKAALDELNSHWPWTVSWQELFDAVQARLASAGVEMGADLKARVNDLLEILILQGQARYRLDPVSPESASGPLRLDEAVRRMAEIRRGDETASTFNLWHETVMLSPVDRHLLPLLDGTRDNDALVAALLNIARQGLIEFDRETVAEHVEALPQRLSAMKLMRVSGS